MTNRIQENQKFFSGEKSDIINLTDGLLKKSELDTLSSNANSPTLARSECLKALENIGGKNFIKKLTDFKTAPGNLWDKYNACNLNNEDIAVFQFIHNLKNPDKKIDIDGQLGPKTYTALMGYKYNEKYDKSITLGILKNRFPTFDNNFLTARSSAIADRQNPFQHNGQSFYRRYDTLISCTASKEKYEKTQEAKDMKEYKSIILQKTVNNIDPIKGFDTGKIYMGSDGNIVGLDYDFENATLAQQCNTIITRKFNSLLKTCKDKKISLSSEMPFSKIYTGSGHFQFDGIYQSGDTYEVDPVFSAEDMGGSNSVLYKIMDKNEDAFLQHLNNRWNELYNKHVVETQKNMFVPGLDINWGNRTEKVAVYLNDIIKKAEEHNKKYPTDKIEPFKNDNSFNDQEIYFTGLENSTRYETKTGAPYPVSGTKKIGFFSESMMRKLGIENIMNDDDNVKKVVKWLNNTWMETHVLKQVTIKEVAASLISKDALRKKLENDVDLTPEELQALQYYENQDFTKAMSAKDLKSQEDYLSLYTRDEGLVKGLGEKTLEHVKTIADAAVAMNPEYAVTILQKLHAQYDDERHPDSAIAILKQFTGHFGQKIYEGLSQKIQKDPKNKEKYQRQLLGLAKLVTDRNGDIDSDLKDIGLAKKIMNDLMPTLIDKSQNNQEWDDQCEKKFNDNKGKVMQIFSTNPQFQKLLGSSNNLSWNSLKTFEEKQYVNTLVEYVIRFGDPKNDKELQNLSPEGQAKKIVERIQALTQISMKGLMKSFTDFADAGGKYSGDLQLTGFQKETYDMYRNMMGIGKFNLSDENADAAVEYSKMAAIIVTAIAATIAVTVATGGTGTGAVAALSRSAVGSMAAGAAAGSLTGYLADYMINQRQAESNEIFMKDMFSTLAVDVATAGPFALVPGLGPLLTKYPRLANIFVKVGKTLGTKAVSGAEMITSAAVSGYAEQWRQQCIMGNEHVTFDQLVQQIGMGLAIPAIFQGGPRMLSYLRTHGELGKINSGLQKSIGYMNEMLKKNLTSEEKQLFANLKKSYVDNASQLEKMLLLENFAKQKEGEKIAIVWGTKQHTLQKVSGGEYVFVSDNGGFVKGEKVTIKEKEGKLIVTRNNGKELGITDWSLDDLNINKKSGNDSGPSIVEIVEGKGDIILDISQIDNIVLSKGHIVVIDGKKYTYNGIKNNEAVFVPKGHTGEIVVVKDAHDLLGDRFNLEPGTKTTNTGRKQKLQELLSNVDDKKDLSQSFVTPNELHLKQDNGSEEVIPLKEEISKAPSREPQKVSSPSYVDQFDVSAKDIVGDLFVDVPKTLSDAMSKLEQFGIWLGKTTVLPTMKFYNDAMQWLKNIQLNFPELSLGKKIDEIKKSIRESVLQERLSVIDSYYSIGQEISIPRSDGSISKGRVESFDSKTGEYKVVREEDGRSYSKEINQTELDKVNVLQVDLDIPKIDQVKSKNYDKYPLVKNILENIKNNEVCKIGFDGKEVSKKKIIDGFLEARFIPNNKVDLGGGNMLFVTNQLECKGRKFIVGYTQQGDVRLFYRSGSEAEWRSTPGLRMGDYAFSKAECIENCSYETTTKCDARIGMTFDSYVIENVDINPLDKSGEIMQEMGFGKVEFNLPSMQKEVSIQSMFAEFSDAVHFYQGKTVQAVQDGYKNLQIPGLDMNSMRLDPNKGYSFTHDYLGKIQVDVVKMSWKGKEIDIHFAIATDGKVFITNMVYSDAKINSFGVYNKQINAGPLTAKPIDYATKGAWQVPSDANFQRYGSYMDIRDLYQDMPLIQEYRKIKSSLNKSKGSNSEIAKANIVENIKNKPDIKEEDVYEIKAEDILTAEDIKPGDVIIDINDIDDNIYK